MKVDNNRKPVGANVARQGSIYEELMNIELEKEAQKRKIEEEENQKIIQQLLNEEKERKIHEDIENQIRGQEEAERLAKELQEEENKRLIEEEKENMPECKICYERIEYDELDPLACGHMFHGQCLEPYIRLKIENKNTVNSIVCPDCHQELDNYDIQNYIDQDLYDKLIKFQFEMFIEQNNKMFSNCPTPDCGFVFEWDGDRENQCFKCGLCNKTYCIFCRVEY